MVGLRWAVALVMPVLASMMGGCTEQAFQCAGPESCVDHGQAGWCESNGFCSYEDPDCESGRSYGTLSGDDLAGQCVPPTAPTMGSTSTTDAGPTTSSSSGSTATTGDPTGDSTTDATTGVDPSGASSTTDDGGSTGGWAGSTGDWGSDSDSGGSTTGDPDACIDEDVGSSVGTPVTSGSTQGTGNSSNPPSGCGPPASPDYVAIWTPPAAGMYSIDTFGSTFDTVLYVKESCSGMALVCDDDTMDLQSQVTLDAQSGTTYYIFVDGFFRSGDFVLNIEAL